MSTRSQSVFAWGLVIIMLAGWAPDPGVFAQDRAAAGSRGWTLEEARAKLQLYPRDAYLQYVTLQLARRENRLDETFDQVRSIVERPMQEEDQENDIGLYSIFSGALAVQESLQLDAMRGNAPGNAAGNRPPTPSKEEMDAMSKEQRDEIEAEGRRLKLEWEKRRAEVALRRKQTVSVASLRGPAVKSHPWKQMLGNRKPEMSPLAMCVPDDFYFVEFHSFAKMLDAIDVSDLWGTHLLGQAFQEARTQRTSERVKQQLALESDPTLRPFYDQVVEEVAVTGSDPFVREGSDVSLLFRIKAPEIFRGRMESFLANARKARPDATSATGKYLDIDYVELATPDRDINVFAAYPAPDLYVRSNSKAAFKRILEAIRGKDAAGAPIQRLGESPEFAYIRTLMARGAAEEDGLIYLSDPFIRSLFGTDLKTTERRRMICYNNMRMIGHASLLYRTEHDRQPDSLATLATSKCSPGLFGAGDVACPDGGKYSLHSDGAAGLCSVHGGANSLTPCIEIPVRQASGEEADEYNAFVKQYNRYWRTFFDPIAIRLQITPKRYRIETIILPLIDNSIYTGLSHLLAGEPESLDSAPVPKRNIFSVGLRLKKEELIAPLRGGSRGSFFGLIDISAEEAGRIEEFISSGLGNQVAVHLYDSHPTFDFNLPSFFGEALARSNGSSSSFSSFEVYISLLVASLSAPVYISVPVKDAKIVDRFIEHLDQELALTTRTPKGGGLFGTDYDFYKFPLNGEQMARAYGIRFGPIKFRVFWSRIGDNLYISSKPFILEDLIAAEAARAGSGDVMAEDRPQRSHALLRIRPQNWNQVLADFRLGWAENNREACLNNLGLLSSVGRAFMRQSNGAAGSTAGSGEELGAQVQRQADRLYASHFFCPDDGHYLLMPDGKTISCSVHGSATSPRQPAAPVESSALGKLLGDFSDLTTTLTFLDDGLRAVVVIDRK